MLQIRRASKSNSFLKLALIGISGSGKTYTALRIARALGERVLVVDTEHGSASKYSEFGFDVVELDNFDPRNYVEAIQLAQREGYDVLVIDSLSHAWTGKSGALEMVDNAAKRTQGNSFGAWRDVTPLHNQLIDAIVGARLHLIATMRAKTEYVQEKDEKTGRTRVRKVGMAPVQRDQMEYEFDVVADLDQEHNFIVSKTRCQDLDGAVIPLPGEQVAQTLRDWLSDAAPPEIPSESNGAALNGHAPEPEPLATDDEIEHYEQVRDVAIHAGYRTPSGSEPKALQPGVTQRECQRRTKALEAAVDDLLKGAPAPPEPLPQSIGNGALHATA